MNPTHHEEQMEAYRRDFQQHFSEVVLPLLKESGVPYAAWPAVEHACWNCFLKGKKPPPVLG